MDSLGLSQWILGHVEHALKLHEKAAEGLSIEVSDNHEDTLQVMKNLGHIYGKCFRFEEARHVQQKAVHGLNETLEENHFDTLIAIEDLAMINLETGELQLA